MKAGSPRGELALRGISFCYIFLLIILPIIAISARALEGSLSNLWRQIVHPQALYSLKLTLFLSLVLVFLNMIMGTLTAWVLVRYPFPGKKLFDTLVDIPFAVPTVVTGIMLVTLYGPRSVIGSFLSRQGIEVIYNKPGIILALAFVTFPFVVRAVQPVLLEMDRDMEEAARILGASPARIFFKVVLPTLLPAILSGGALSFARALGEFGSIVIVAGNIPFKTQVSSVYIYGEIESANTQGALGTALVLLAASLAIIVLLNKIQKWSRKHAEI